MKIFVAPLNWGLGHATRCIPLIQRFLQEGHEVVLGGDGISLLLLRRTFPTLRIIPLIPLSLRYSASNSQVWAVVRMLPKLLIHTWKERRLMQRIAEAEQFDMILSDNRFGVWAKHTARFSGQRIYLTHQLQVLLPRGWQWLQTIATACHAAIYTRFDEVWVPDFVDENKRLSGILSKKGILKSVRYIGILSRLLPSNETCYDYDVVALLSGLEPQRTLLENDLIERYKNADEKVLIVRGKIGQPFLKTTHRHLTLVPYMYDAHLVPLLQGAKKIIARSGYSTIMDLAALGLLHKAELIPTPGQPEQEYLAQHLTTVLQSDPSSGTPPLSC